MQGYGMLTLEESLHTPSGQLLARGPGAYKIPGFGDCPKQFNVHLLKNVANERAVCASKVRVGCSIYTRWNLIQFLRRVIPNTQTALWFLQISCFA